VFQSSGVSNFAKAKASVTVKVLILIFTGTLALESMTTLAPSEQMRPGSTVWTRPSKRWVWFENSAHMIWAEEPGRVLVSLVQLALPFAAASARANE
jgi:hypothetical protein